MNDAQLNLPLLCFLELAGVPVGPCLGFYVLDPVLRNCLDEEWSQKVSGGGGSGSGIVGGVSGK